MKDRAYIFIITYGITEDDFCQKCKISRRTMNSHRDFSWQEASRINRAYPELNIDWVLTGTGNMMN